MEMIILLLNALLSELMVRSIFYVVSSALSSMCHIPKSVSCLWQCHSWGGEWQKTIVNIPVAEVGESLC